MAIDLTSLDREVYLSKFKEFLATKPLFSDYKFEGSNFSILLDTFAYDFQNFALLATLTSNECNLKTAQNRGRVASLANNLNYVAKSRKAAEAIVNIVVDNPVGVNPTTLSLQDNVRLTSVINGDEFVFVVKERQESIISLDGRFYFNNVPIIQGVRKTIYYKYDTSEVRPAFVIPDIDVDTTTLKVVVKPSDVTDFGESYFQYETIENLLETSSVYFLEENYNGTYQVRFGDGKISKEPANGNIIEISYIYTKGEPANGAKQFYTSDSIGGNASTTVTTVQPAVLGAERESIDSIKFNAPLLRARQNRVVTDVDYLSYITSFFPDVSSISVWGGENNDIPLYSRIVISIKPKSKDALSDEEKEIIATQLAKKADPAKRFVFTDPEFTYLKVENEFKYVPSRSLLSKASLETLVTTTIFNYSLNNLEKFDGVFRASNLMAQIDAVDNGITSNINRVYMYKIFTPYNDRVNNIEYDYGNEIYITDTTMQTLSSTPFLVNGETHYMADMPSLVSGIRTIYMYKLVAGQRQTVLYDIGEVRSREGKVIIRNFKPDTTAPINIYILPNSEDLKPKRNQLLQIKKEAIISTANLDTIILGGSAFGLEEYVTSSKGKL